MLKNYLKITFRNLLRNKSFSFINITGLAVSMSVCLLVMLIIADQKSYDQFHTHKNRIYRVNTEGRSGNNFKSATSALPLGEKLKKEYTGIEATASLVRNIGGDVIYNEKIASGGGYFADAQLFKVFDFELSKGNPKTALQNPFSLVISEEMATILFDKEEPLGKTVKFNDTGIVPGVPDETGSHETEYGIFTITGILKKPVGKTHLQFKLLTSLSTLPSLTQKSILNYPPNDWSNVWTTYTYILLEKGKNKADLQASLNQIAAKQYPKSNQDQFDFKAVTLSEITLSDPIGNVSYLSVPATILIVLSVLGLIVMLSACLNYTNLSIAKALTRAKEVGIRKVVGATRKHVFAQFITEAVVISLLALVMATGILYFLKFAFSGLMLNQYLNITFNENVPLILIFIGFSILIGIIAGTLPSFYISGFNPVQILKNVSRITFFRKLTLRKVLLVVQFCISLTFVISTTLLYYQINHLLKVDYGFDKNNVVNIKLHKTENYQRFAQTIASDKNVLGVSACSFIPATGTNMGTMVHKADNSKDSIQINFLDIDSHFLSVWGLKLIAGKNLPENTDTTAERYVLINEKMVKDFNYNTPQNAVGQRLKLEGSVVEILGVVKDFNFRDVTKQSGVLVLRNRIKQFGYANVKIYGKNVISTVIALEKTWKKVNPHSKFEYKFLDQQLLAVSSVLEDLAKILGLLAFLAVFISCLGLLGMAIYTAETRTKEISIRKVLGASVGQIAVLLSKSFVYLLLIAIMIAVPLSFVVNNLWLNFFAYRVSLGIEIFLISIGLMLVISLLIIFSQTLRVALANPMKSLRTE